MNLPLVDNLGHSFPASAIMTGIEAAGFVLAAIPLVIAALENYESFIDPTKAFVKYRGELSRATRQLVNHYTSYEQSVQILLTPIADREDVCDMMENMGNELWKDKEIERALQRRLGRSYHAYLRTVHDIESAMRSIAEHLNIDGADKITHEGLEAIIAAHPPVIQPGKLPKFEFRKRVKFTMKRQKIRILLDDLTKTVDQLDSYLDKAEKLEESYKANRKSKLAFPLRLMQRNAARLYDVISQAWCSTHSTHSAGILLEQRLVKRTKRHMAGRQGEQLLKKSDSSCFAVSLSQTSPARKWLEAEFRIVEAPTDDESSRSVLRRDFESVDYAEANVPAGQKCNSSFQLHLQPHLRLRQKPFRMQIRLSCK